jgi:hypothetical protein
LGEPTLTAVMPNLFILTEQQNFTEHSGISAIDGYWLEQHFETAQDERC